MKVKVGNELYDVHKIAYKLGKTRATLFKDEIDEVIWEQRHNDIVPKVYFYTRIKYLPDLFRRRKPYLVCSEDQALKIIKHYRGTL